MPINISQYLATHTTKTIDLKDHPQVGIIIDLLIRRENHHILLTGCTCEKMNLAILQALAAQLTLTTIPKSLRNAELIYTEAHELNPETLMRSKEENSSIILAIQNIPTATQLDALAKIFSSAKNFRIIILTPKFHVTHLAPAFSTLKLREPSHTELLQLLKSQRLDLEKFHHVIIPDDVVVSALNFAAHYLPGKSALDEASKLLDSCAARASTTSREGASENFKPVVTPTLLSQIVSSHTQIPISHLHGNPFQAITFTNSMQRRIFGQDAAIGLIGSKLQYACIQLQKKAGPLCSFLLAGPPDSGKTEAAYAMAEHLFGHPNALLHVNLSKTHYASFSDIKVISAPSDNHCMSLLEAIRQTPYAIVLIENISQAPAGTLDFFKDIFMHGYTVDSEGNQYDFRHAIIMMTTTLGSERITQLTQTPQNHEATKTVDLMQLVLNENLHDSANHHSHQISPEELCDEITPMLEAYFSANLLHSLNIIPFIPLDYAALEKIMRVKIKVLAKQLDQKFGIELNYAPEVIQFLAHEALWRKPHPHSLENLLEKHLYSCVAHEILAHSEDKNRPKRLMLQLNDMGQLLRCDFMMASETGVYSL